MFNIYDSIFTNTGEGIQDLEVFFDSLFFNIKVQDGMSNPNLLLIEKVRLDYDSGEISNPKPGIIIDFGDTGISESFSTTGNTYIKSFLDDTNKEIFIMGLSASNSYIIPVIYNYNINKHTASLRFPLASHISDWNNFTNFVFNSSQFPVSTRVDNKITVCFGSVSGDNNILNIISLDTETDGIRISDYKMIENIPNDIVVEGIDNNNCYCRVGEYRGSFIYK